MALNQYFERIKIFANLVKKLNLLEVLGTRYNWKILSTYLTHQALENGFFVGHFKVFLYKFGSNPNSLNFLTFVVLATKSQEPNLEIIINMNNF